MKYVLKSEELVMFLACLGFMLANGVPWWTYILLLIGPDIGMVGYLINARIGAYTYNLFHHKAVAILILAAGILMSSQAGILFGVILFGHSSMDRVFGFGLKHTDDFKNTHLGRIGH